MNISVLMETTLQHSPDLWLRVLEDPLNTILQLLERSVPYSTELIILFSTYLCILSCRFIFSVLFLFPLLLFSSFGYLPSLPQLVCAHLHCLLSLVSLSRMWFFLVSSFGTSSPFFVFPLWSTDALPASSPTMTSKYHTKQFDAGYLFFWISYWSPC